MYCLLLARETCATKAITHLVTALFYKHFPSITPGLPPNDDRLSLAVHL